MKILMRGDCTSRRAVFYNKDLFGGSTSVVQNQKSPFVMFNEHARGVDASLEQLLPFVDYDGMPTVQKAYFAGQFERSILEQDGADLLIVDSYADMNFELFEPVGGGGKFWVSRRYLRDVEGFDSRFVSIGRRSLQQSVEDAIEFIGLVRKRYGPIPVIFLNQQVEFYPKLHQRLEYYDMGRLVADRVEGCEYGGILDRSELELADIGSCGPGLTLHYTGGTYRKMLARIPLAGTRPAPAQAPPRAGTGSGTPAPADTASAGEAAVPAQTAGSDERPLEIALRPDDRAAPYDRDKIFGTFRRYFSIPEADVYDPKAVPAVIELDRLADYPAWVRQTRRVAGDNAFRSEKKAAQRGYFVEMFHRSTFVPDIHAINTSMPVRSGGLMKGAYQQSIEQMGGLPAVYRHPRLGADPAYWVAMFGAFLPAPGWKQGDVVTDKRLVGYISVRRYGDLVFYPQVMGHGEHLQHGVVALIHFHILRWLASAGNRHAAGAKVLMYTDANAPNEGLRTWKKRAGFEPRRITVRAY